MANPELFRIKNHEQLADQVSNVSTILGESITPHSVHEEILGLPLDELKQRFSERYRIYLDTLRRSRIGDPPHPSSIRTLRTLNRLDDYIYTHNNNMTTRTLLDRQMTVFEDIRNFFESGGRSGYVKLPTAAGKTVIFTELIEATGLKALVVMPTKTLVDQTGERFQQFAPTIEVGKVYQDAKEYDRPVTLTTYDSFIKAVELGKISPHDYDDGLLILDEGHKTLSQLRRETVGLFKGAIKLGFTATPKYATNKELKDLLGHEIHAMDIPEAVELWGLLSPLSVYLAQTDIDLSNIRVTANEDYDEGDLDRAINITSRNIAAVDVYQQLFPGQKTLVYCVGVKHAEVLAKTFNDRGIAADFISGNQSRSEQHDRLKRFKSGEIKILCNANILIEGFDEPSATVCLNLRPTLSAVVAEQRGGRVLRLDPNNPDKHAIIVDFVGKDYSAGSFVGRNPPITFAQILERAAIFRKVTHEGGEGGGTSIYPNIEISGIRVITNANEVMRVVREISGITEEGWYSVSALSRRFRLPEEFMLRFLKLIHGVHPEYFEMRLHNGQPREYMSPEVLGVLRSYFDHEQRKKDIQEDEFPVSSRGLASNFRGRVQRTRAVAESVLAELMRQDPNLIRVIPLGNPMIVVTRERFMELMKKRGMRLLEENEIAITAQFLNTNFIGGDHKLRPISNNVLQEIIEKYPGSWRIVTVYGRPVIFLKTELQSLYVQLMKAKGIELKGSTMIDSEHEVAITVPFFRHNFIGGESLVRPISDVVLQDINEKYPGSWRIATSASKKKRLKVLKKELEALYMQLMQERGVRLR